MISFLNPKLLNCVKSVSLFNTKHRWECTTSVSTSKMRIKKSQEKSQNHFFSFTTKKSTPKKMSTFFLRQKSLFRIGYAWGGINTRTTKPYQESFDGNLKKKFLLFLFTLSLCQFHQHLRARFFACNIWHLFLASGNQWMVHEFCQDYYWMFQSLSHRWNWTTIFRQTLCASVYLFD